MQSTSSRLIPFATRELPGSEADTSDANALNQKLKSLEFSNGRVSISVSPACPAELALIKKAWVPDNQAKRADHLQKSLTSIESKLDKDAIAAFSLDYIEPGSSELINKIQKTLEKEQGSHPLLASELKFDPETNSLIVKNLNLDENKTNSDEPILVIFKIPKSKMRVCYFIHPQLLRENKLDFINQKIQKVFTAYNHMLKTYEDIFSKSFDEAFKSPGLGKKLVAAKLKDHTAIINIIEDNFGDKPFYKSDLPDGEGKTTIKGFTELGKDTHEKFLRTISKVLNSKYQDPVTKLPKYRVKYKSSSQDKQLLLHKSGMDHSKIQGREPNYQAPEDNLLTHELFHATSISSLSSRELEKLLEIKLGNYKSNEYTRARIVSFIKTYTWFIKTNLIQESPYLRNWLENSSMPLNRTKLKDILKSLTNQTVKNHLSHMFATDHLEETLLAQKKSFQESNSTLKSFLKKKLSYLKTKLIIGLEDFNAHFIDQKFSGDGMDPQSFKPEYRDDLERIMFFGLSDKKEIIRQYLAEEAERIICKAG